MYPGSVRPVKARGWAFASLLVVVCTAGFLTLPARLYTGDPRAWREEARSIVLFQTLAVEASVAKSFGRPGQFCVLNPQTGKWYSKYGIVNGLLNVPPLLAEYLVTGELPPHNSQLRPLFLSVYFLLLTLGIAWLLYAVTAYYVSNPWARATFVLLAFYATYVWNYLRATTGESTQLAGFLLFWLFFVRFTRGVRDEKGSGTVVPSTLRAVPATVPDPFSKQRVDLWLAWLALGVLCQTKVSYLSLLPVFGGVVAWTVAKAASFGEAPNAKAGSFGYKRVMLMVVLPSLLILLAQGAVHYFKFGSPFLSGYHQYWEPDPLPSVGTLIEDFVFSPQWSLFVHFPLLLLALPFGPRFVRRHCLEAAGLGIVFVMTLMVVSQTPFWRGEWCFGPRYFVFVLPLLALPALYPLEWAWGAVARDGTPNRTVAKAASFSTGEAEDSAKAGSFGYGDRTQPLRLAFLGMLFVVGTLLAFVQFQVHRLDFFFKYHIQPNLAAVQSPVVRDYFKSTNFAKINWDHLQCRGAWHKLPYYSELQQELGPAALARWERNLEQWVERSNLWWFP